MVALKVQITDQQAERLDDLARRLDVASDTLAATAIEAFLDRESWQIAEIEAGLREAGQGDFASENEIAGIFAKYPKS
jgi:predicted transcriptional regulator